MVVKRTVEREAGGKKINPRTSGFRAKKKFIGEWKRPRWRREETKRQKEKNSCKT